MRPLDKWHNMDQTPPQDGTTFPGRICGTNRVIAVAYDGPDNVYRAMRHGRLEESIIIDQWLTWAELGEIQSCLWKAAK